MTKLHSRHSAYYLLMVTCAAIEGVFGWRAAVMYAGFLGPYLDLWELIAFCVVVFLGVAVAGYVLSTHRQYGLEAVVDRIKARHSIRADAQKAARWAYIATFAGCFVVIIHDWSGVVYTVFGTGRTPANFITVVITIGMCAFCLLPFLLGHMMLALADGINEEAEQSYDRKIDKLDKKYRIEAAEELIRQASNLSPEERLSHGVKGLIAQSTTQVQEETNSPLASPRLNLTQANQPGNNHRSVIQN